MEAAKYARTPQEIVGACQEPLPAGVETVEALLELLQLERGGPDGIVNEGVCVFALETIPDGLLPEFPEDTPPLELVRRATPESWEAVFRQSWFDLEEACRKVEEFEKEGETFPRRQDIFRVFYSTKLTEVKVVILGQDPYHNTDGTGRPIASLPRPGCG